MKVLITASTTGHIRSFHLPYIDAFRSLGWTVHVAAGGDGDIGQADRLIHLPFEKSMTSPRNFKAAKILRRLMEAEAYDLICTHTSLAAFFTRLAVKAIKKRPRVVNVVHGYLFDDETKFPKKQLLIQAEKLVADCTDLILTMNEWDFNFAKTNKLAAEVDFIPGIGVPYERFAQSLAITKQEARMKLGLPPDKFIFIYPAEFSERKSQSTLIQALSHLPENVHLILPGDGQLREECIAQTHKLSLDGRIEYPGHVDCIGLFYRASDAAVSSSRSEGLPFNILEAAYFYLPIAASRVKGHTDLLNRGLVHASFDFGDPLDAAAAMRTVMEAEAKGVCDACRDVCNSYDIHAVLPLIIRAVRSVIQ